jgi:hypothetical protein
MLPGCFDVKDWRMIFPAEHETLAVKHRTFYSEVAVLTGIIFKRTPMHEISSASSKTFDIVQTFPDTHKMQFAATSNQAS